MTQLSVAMPQVEEATLPPSPRPELEEEDYNAPFLHETTSFTLVVLVLFALVFTCVLIGFALYLA